MKLSCAICTFVILTSLMHGQQTTGVPAGASDEQDCDHAISRSWCLRVNAQLRESEKHLADTLDNWKKLGSAEPNKQIDGIVGVTKDFNSKFNDHDISKAVTDKSIDAIGRVAQQESQTLGDVDRSIQTVFTASEQADFTQQMKHYTHAIVTREAAQMIGQVSGNRISGGQSAGFSPSVQVHQTQPPSSWHSGAFSAEEQISIDSSLSTGIVKKHVQEHAAARAAVLAEQKRKIAQAQAEAQATRAAALAERRRKIAEAAKAAALAKKQHIEADNQRKIAKAQAAWAAQHPQQFTIRPPVVDCSGEWDSPPPGCSQRPSSYTSCGDSACTAK